MNEDRSLETTTELASRRDLLLATLAVGGVALPRWLERPEAVDPDQFIELISYPQTRGYVRSVLRNRDLYRALYPPNRSEPESR